MDDIVFYEAFKEEAAALKKYLPKTIRACFIAQTIQESPVQKSCPLISIRTQSRIPLSWRHRLNGVLTRSTGYDHLAYFRRETKNKVPCGYLPNYCSRAVAEQAVLMLMALQRKLPQQQSQFKNFNRDDLTGHEILNKNLLVVGVGHIGSEIVRMGRALGMKVQGVDPKQNMSGLKYTPLSSGIRGADTIVCAASLTQRTKGLLDYQALKRAKAGCVVVNIARGEITPLKDLKRLLDQNKLGGVGLDVYENEALLASFMRHRRGKAPAEWGIIEDLRGRSNVILTPHNAFNTVEAVNRKALDSVQAVVQFLSRRTFPHFVP